MKITAIETYPVRIPLRPEYRMVSSLGKHDVSDYVLVRVSTDNDLEGVGEATVMPRWSGETVWGAKYIIDQLLAPAVMGCDLHNLEDNIEEIDQRMDAVCAHNWFAKAAVEMACWDIQGKAAGKPVFELLGGPHRDLSIRCRFSLGAYDVERARKRAEELIAQGFTTIKVKVGGKAEDDIARVRTVREVIGDHRDLVIDANGGWDAETAIKCINELADCRITLVEQPTPDGDFGAMAQVRRETKPPILADDICFDLADAQELLRNECCDAISVYPGKNGGIRKSKKIVELAERRGVACSIGSNLEWDVATAAMGHLVVGLKNMNVETYPGDVLGPIYHEIRIAKPPLQIEGPTTTINTQPGLGVVVDWEVVRENIISS